jgi:hypothetical protein
MVILRCTQKLRKRLQATNPPPALSSTTLLGDWYCHLLHLGRTQAILCLSEQTRLPILLPARTAHLFPQRLQLALAAILAALDIPALAIQQELLQMSEYVIAPTASRSVLGSLNDFEQAAQFLIDPCLPTSFQEVSTQLAQTPCRPLAYQSPATAIQQHFRQASTR